MNDSQLLIGKRLAGLSLTLLLIAATGCGPRNVAMPPKASAEEAQAALEKALAHWQAGQTPETLASADPKTYVNDYDWRDGRKLRQFQLAGPVEAIGLQVRLPVALDVEHDQGQVVRSQVSYSISTTPVVSIVRDDP